MVRSAFIYKTSKYFWHLSEAVYLQKQTPLNLRNIF